MSSAEKQKLNDSEIVPVINDSGLFQGHEDNRFSLGVFSAEDVLSYEEKNNSLIEGYLQLRANVYIDQENILGADSRRHDGTELDSDDERSVHFVVFEKCLGHVAVIASMRLIVKDDEEKPLPLETVFGSIFPLSLEKGSVEVSRFIARHNNDSFHKEAKARTIMAALAFVSTNEYGPVVAEIEKPLRRSLGMFGIKTEILGPSAFVEEGGRNGEEKHFTELVPVKIPTSTLKERFGNDAVEEMSIGVGEFTYWGKSVETEDEG